MKEKIKNIIYKNSKKGGMSEEIDDGQIIGLKTGNGLELDVVSTEIAELYKPLLLESDSTLSFLHHRGYIDYSKSGCPTQQEVNNLIGKLRESYQLT